MSLAAVALVLCACSTKPPLPSGAIAVPTDDNVVSSAQSGILCTADGVIPPVFGILEGDASDPAWPVWLQASDGRQLFVRWPRGFSVRFDPTVALLDETGAVFLQGGSPITLGQVALDPAGGTKEHPFMARGLIETGLGGEQHCYTPKA